MPCYRCDRVQTDPGRGASPWKRGVVAGAQVLVCPTCQQEHDWTGDLDRCADCGSTRLARSLGDTRCLDCGAAVADVASDASSPSDARPGPLSAQVSEALRKVFGHEDRG